MNAIMHIAPYRTGRRGWAFDDKSRGLLKEPFVLGIPDIIDIFAGDRDEIDIYFSASEFPECQGKLKWMRSEKGGNYYNLIADGQPPMIGWLCPALLAYFDEAPAEIWFMIK
jgi:hypothetical protein